VTLHHVNFHTLHGKPVFEHDPYDRMLRACLPEVLASRAILCAAWEIMPTHVHLIIEDFPDLMRSTIIKHIKGDTSRAFFRAFPELRPDLLGGHLWAKGYFAVPIVSHQQFKASVAYVRTNRNRAGLAPPMALTAIDR
jgi:putative transposase